MKRKLGILLLFYLVQLACSQQAEAKEASRGDEPPLILEFINDQPKLDLDEDLLSESEADSLHQLSAETSELVESSTRPAVVDEVLASVADAELKQELIKIAYGTESQKQLDSAQLVNIADACLSLGLKDQALTAYRRAVELNPNSLSAQHALAKATDDKQERARSYLKSVSTEALTSVADSWFAVPGAPSTTIAAAMIPYQFAILKEPTNASLRYQFARRLESAGLSYYAQSSKRYLESAVLAKQKFIAGDKTVEALLRDSIEALIRTLAIQGDFDGATKYCHSYMSLGYERFSAGDSVRGIMRKIQARRNPFRIVALSQQGGEAS